MGKEILLEIAVGTLGRARAAENAGAHRLELCESLETGGLTPSLELHRQVRAAVRVPIHVLVRPRPGDFHYSDTEFRLMKSAIAALRNENINGIVTGILRSDHSVDIERTGELVVLAAPLPVTYHRAFDETPNLSQALEDVIRAGANRILTSAGAASAADAAKALRQLIEQAASRLIILPGGGLQAANIGSLVSIPGVRELHTGLGSVLPYTNPDVAAFQREVHRCLTELRHL